MDIASQHIIIPVEGEVEKEIENSRVCIEKLVINDGTYGNQVPVIRFRKRYFIKETSFEPFSNCWTLITVETCLNIDIDIDRFEAIRYNDLYRAVSKKRVRC